MATDTLQCNTLVLKVASRCNLNCTYCYMYNMGDSSFKDQPKFMSDNVVDALIEKVRLHCDLHDIKLFSFAFHGGEPLLAGEDFFRKFTTKAKERLLPVIIPQFLIQTNAVLITREWSVLLDELDIQVGISLDGTKAAHDAFRVDHAGRGSYEQVVKGLSMVQQNTSRNLEAGVLCVINIDSDPVEIYHHFKSLHINNVNFLWPDANYTHLPVRPKQMSEPAPTPYGDWLIRLFDVWFNDDRNQMSIQYFRKLIHAILGRQVVSDTIGTGNNEVLIIETNGGIESLDVLKICGEAFTKNNTNILTHTIDEAIQTPLARLYQLSHKNLNAQCVTCPIVEICGGGYLPHRYSIENGFDNPSIYCRDLLKLISHVQNSVVRQLPETLLKEAGVSMLTYEEALEQISSARTWSSPVTDELEAY